MRPALEDFTWNLYLRLTQIVAFAFFCAARIARNTTGLLLFFRVLRFIPICGPLPDVADHVIDSMAVRRICTNGRCSFVSVFTSVLPWKFALPEIRHRFAIGHQ